MRSRRFTPHLTFAAIAASVCCVLCACSPRAIGPGVLTEGDGPATLTPITPADLIDTIAPVRVRLHALSRVDAAADATQAQGQSGGQSGGQTRLYVELLDSEGRGIIWPGIFRVTTASVQGSATAPTSWWFDAQSPRDNASVYDNVTRLYVLTIPAALAPNSTDLLSGNRLTVEFRVGGTDRRLTSD
jgi:hypothetical protein